MRNWSWLLGLALFACSAAACGCNTQTVLLCNQCNCRNGCDTSSCNVFGCDCYCYAPSPTPAPSGPTPPPTPDPACDDVGRGSGRWVRISSSSGGHDITYTTGITRTYTNTDSKTRRLGEQRRPRA